MIFSFLLLLSFLSVYEASSSSSSRKRGRNSPEKLATDILNNPTADLLALGATDPQIPAVLRGFNTVVSHDLANRCTLMNHSVKEQLFILMKDCPRIVHIMTDVKAASILIAQYLTSNELYHLTSTTKLLWRLELADGWFIDRTPEFFYNQRLLYPQRIHQKLGNALDKEVALNRLLRWAFHYDYFLAQYILSVRPIAYFYSGFWHHRFDSPMRNSAHFNGLVSPDGTIKYRTYTGFRNYLFKHVKLDYPYDEYDMEDKSMFWARVFNTHLRAYLNRHPEDVDFRREVEAVERRYPNPYDVI